jgi:hypothetical protein
MDLSGIDPAAASDAYDGRGVPTWSDDELTRAVGAVLARPKVAPADSFVLHAPLELLARRRLLGRVAAEDRDAARRRLVWLAAAYEAAGDELDDPTPGRRADVDGSVDAIAARLVAALAAGDLDDIDVSAAALAARATPADLRRLLGPTVATSLAAAAHGSIFLALLGHVQADDEAGGLTFALRGLARDLGRHPDWQLRWFEDPDPDEPGPPAALADALLEVPMLGPVGNNFIQPIMHQAEESGIAAKLLGATLGGAAADVARARAELGRIAAWSMLQEPGGHAYGWSHCLTMPQAVLALTGSGADADVPARAAVAIAATHVVGFRAAIGQRPLVPAFDPVRPAVGDLAEAVAAGPGEAASFAWCEARDGGPEAVARLVTGLAGPAARHVDAHYAKYTQACFDAAAADPAQQPLYLAAAAFLAGYWAAKGDDDLLRTAR